MEKKIELSQLFSRIDAQLKTVYEDPILCRQYAWWLLEAITRIKKAQLITLQEIALSLEQKEKLAAAVHKLVHENMPIQYLLGSVPFNNVDILVEPPILIPRPETEEWCINLIKQLDRLSNKKIAILDLCSGSGCIGIALAKHCTQATVVGVDINQLAVGLGKKNAEHNKIRNIEFLQSDLFSFDKLRMKDGDNQQFDLIVANPPYIASAFWNTLEPSVKNWEDKHALIARDHGLAIIKKIIKQAYAHLKDNIEFLKKELPQLVIEIDYNQGAAVAELMRTAGYENVQIHQDLEKKDRVVSGSKSYVAQKKK